MNESIFSFSCTEQGYNHLKSRKKCEDASVHYSDDNVHICVVADGHGSDNYPRTDRGAQYAVNAAVKCIIDFVKNADPQMVLRDEAQGHPLLLQLARSILNEWYSCVEEDYSSHPFSSDELINVSDKYKRYYLSSDAASSKKEKAYGCTLIAFVVTQDYSFGLQIGDGRCVMEDQYGQFSEPIPWDDNCQLNVTTSICDGNAIDEFRFFITNQIPAAVFCGTDGVDDSYANFEELEALYRSIIKIFGDYGKEKGIEEIEEYLPKLTMRGSGDDISVAAVINMAAIQEIMPIIDLQMNLYKASEQLIEKQLFLERLGSKRERLFAGMESVFQKAGYLVPIAKEIDDIKEQQVQLIEEIRQTERSISDMDTQIQGLIYERQAASFELPDPTPMLDEIGIDEFCAFEEDPDDGETG